MANNLFDVLMPAITKQGHLLFIPYLLYVLWKGNSTKKIIGEPYLKPALWAIFIAVCSLFVAEGIGIVIKYGIARIRPCHVLEGIRILTNCPQSYSMPSGHALRSFALAIPLFYLTREYISAMWRLYPLALALCVTFSRVYVGAHYPSDVIAGALLGSVTAILLIIIRTSIGTSTSCPEQSHKDKAIL
jgi:undecaprenyl-diphosphatase